MTDAHEKRARVENWLLSAGDGYREHRLRLQAGRVKEELGTLQDKPRITQYAQGLTRGGVPVEVRLTKKQQRPRSVSPAEDAGQATFTPEINDASKRVTARYDKQTWQDRKERRLAVLRAEKAAAELAEVTGTPQINPASNTEKVSQRTNGLPLPDHFMQLEHRRQESLRVRYEQNMDALMGQTPNARVDVSIEGGTPRSRPLPRMQTAPPGSITPPRQVARRLHLDAGGGRRSSRDASSRALERSKTWHEAGGGLPGQHGQLARSTSTYSQLHDSRRRRKSSERSGYREQSPRGCDNPGIAVQPPPPPPAQPSPSHQVAPSPAQAPPEAPEAEGDASIPAPASAALLTGADGLARPSWVMPAAPPPAPSGLPKRVHEDRQGRESDTGTSAAATAPAAGGEAAARVDLTALEGLDDDELLEFLVHRRQGTTQQGRKVAAAEARWEDKLRDEGGHAAGRKAWGAGTGGQHKGRPQHTGSYRNKDDPKDPRREAWLRALPIEDRLLFHNARKRRAVQRREENAAYQLKALAGQSHMTSQSRAIIEAKKLSYDEEDGPASAPRKEKYLGHEDELEVHHKAPVMTASEFHQVRSRLFRKEEAKQRRLEELREQQHVEAMRECVFQPGRAPAVANRPRRHSAFAATRSTTQPLPERALAWVAKREQRLSGMKRDTDADEMAGCTFAPYTNTEVPATDVDTHGITGYDEAVDRMRKARDNKVEERGRRERVLEPMKNTWTGAPTVPVAPRLGPKEWSGRDPSASGRGSQRGSERGSAITSLARPVDPPCRRPTRAHVESGEGYASAHARSQSCYDAPGRVAVFPQGPYPLPMRDAAETAPRQGNAPVPHPHTQSGPGANHTAYQRQMDAYYASPEYAEWYRGYQAWQGSQRSAQAQAEVPPARAAPHVVDPTMSAGELHKVYRAPAVAATTPAVPRSDGGGAFGGGAPQVYRSDVEREGERGLDGRAAVYQDGVSWIQDEEEDEEDGDGVDGRELYASGVYANRHTYTHTEASDGGHLHHAEGGPYLQFLPQHRSWRGSSGGSAAPAPVYRPSGSAAQYPAPPFAQVVSPHRPAGHVDPEDFVCRSVDAEGATVAIPPQPRARVFARDESEGSAVQRGMADYSEEW